MSEAKRRRVLIHGRVQGVNFRGSVRREAQRRGVAGWVCNRADGAVEAVFEGPPSAVDAIVDFCERGPRGADVERVDVSEEQAEGLEGFQVR
jgi:acylphosphatase